MLESGFRIGEVSTMKWEDVDFENNVIYLFRSKVGNEDFIPMTKRLRATLENRKLSFDGEYVFAGVRRPKHIFTETYKDHTIHTLKMHTTVNQRPVPI